MPPSVKLTPIGRQLLAKAALAMLEHPQTINMTDWLQSEEPIELTEVKLTADCKTAGCILGHCLVYGAKDYPTKLRLPSDYYVVASGVETESGDEYGQWIEALEATCKAMFQGSRSVTIDSENIDIFWTGKWPEPFATAYERLRLQELTAKAANDESRLQIIQPAIARILVAVIYAWVQSGCPVGFAGCCFSSDCLEPKYLEEAISFFREGLE